MTWTDLSRRAATVLLVVLCLLAVPAIANARFSSPQAASQQVGTAVMATPSAVTGTWTCSRQGQQEQLVVTVDSFTDTGPAGSTYAYSIAVDGLTKQTVGTSSRTASLLGTRPRDSLATSWTVTIQSKLRSWTGGTFTRTVVCPSSATGSGAL
jgi:hypothetical protein